MEGNLNTLIRRVENDNFDSDNLSAYHLYIKIYNTGLSFGIFNPESTEFSYYEKHQFFQAEDVGELINYLKDIWNNHDLLNSNSWNKITLIVNSNNFTYIPSNIYDPNAAIGYLKLNCKIDESENKIASFEEETSQSTCCFPVEVALYDWLKAVYTGVDINFIHASTSFTNGVLQDIDTLSKICIMVQDNLLTIAYNKNQSLQFINIYNFITDEDFVYYILLVYEELDLNTSQTPLIIWGIDEKAQKISKLKNYIANISVGHFPKNLNYTPEFTELPQQYEFDLFQTPLLMNK